MSELDVSLLVRRTGLLLRFYPPAYRAHRGEEILDTLLETTRPGRGWPPARETASLIAGGLRARRAANLNQGLRASLRHVGILAAAMIMMQDPAALLGAISQHMANPFRPYGPAGMELGLALASLLVVMALAATWCGRRRLVFAAVVAAVLVAVLAVLPGLCRRRVGNRSGGNDNPRCARARRPAATHQAGGASADRALVAAVPAPGRDFCRGIRCRVRAGC